MSFYSARTVVAVSFSFILSFLSYVYQNRKQTNRMMLKMFLYDDEEVEQQFGHLESKFLKEPFVFACFVSEEK